MSIHAIAWVFDQDIRPSWLKFTLVAFADCANEKDEMKCWPSIAHVCAVTSQDRKTVIGSIADLVGRGWLVDTGERRGKTKQVKVYMLCLPKTNSTVDGIVKESRPSLERVPSADGKESRPRDTEPLIEPLIEPVEATGIKKVKTENPKDPNIWDSEILPYEWCSFAERLNIPDDKIYRSWEKFKSMSESPWTRERWHNWIGREKVTKRDANNDGYMD